MDEERLIVALEARITDFEKKMKAAERTGTRSYTRLRRDSGSATRQMETDMLRSTTAINRALATTSARIGTFGKAFAVGLVATGMQQFTTNVRGAVTELSNLAKVADRTNFKLDDLQGLNRGFELAGVNADKLSGSLQEFGKRVGEAAQGGGELVAVLDRYGIALTGNDGKMKSQMQLLREFSNTIKSAASDQERLFIADKTFGGGGLEMVNALAGGAAGIDEMIRSARDAGYIMDESLIRKAEELDDRFADLQRRTGLWFKSFAVGTADIVDKLTSVREAVEDVYPAISSSRNIFGDELTDSLLSNADAADAAEASAARLLAEYRDLTTQAQTTAYALEQAVPTALQYGYYEVGEILRDAAMEMRTLIRAMGDGSIEAAEFDQRMDAVTQSAAQALGELDAVDRADFNNAIGGVDLLGAALARAVSMAASLRESLPGTVAPDGGGGRGDGEAEVAARRARSAQLTAQRDFEAAETDRNEASREQLALQREIASVMAEAAEAGYVPTGVEAEALAAARIAAEDARRESARGDGGGSKSKGGAAENPDAFTVLTKSTRDEIAQLEMEAVELLAVAESGREVGNAMEYARRKAELLYAAQQDGRDITPQLRAEVDALALAHTEAGAAAQDAAQRLTLIEDNARRGADAMSGLFLSILDGSMSARDAMAQLLQEIAKVQIQKAILGIAGLGGGGGFFGGLGNMLSLSGGGYTGDGGKFEPKGIVHGGEFVFSKRAVQSIGLDRLETLHQSVKGYSEGGEVAATPAPEQEAPTKQAPAPAAQQVELLVRAEKGITIETVRNEAGLIVRHGLDTYDTMLESRVAQISSDPRVR